MPLAPGLSHYRRMLRAGGSQPSARAFEAKEASSSAEDLDLSSPAVSDRLDATGRQLHEVVRRYLGDRAELHAIVDEIIKQGGLALDVLAADDQQRFMQDVRVQAGFEAIVRTDGSRPSLMVRNGAVDRNTSPVGSWKEALDQSRPALEPALACVGRIDLPDLPYGRGTGFLIDADLILTNRHVLQVIAEETAPGEWKLEPGASIDFGHEFRSSKPYPRRALKRVVFCGSAPIDLDGPVDHKKLDLALIALEKAAGTDTPNVILAVNVAPDWAKEGTTIFIVGYPGPPRPGTPSTLLEQLFQQTYGCKRLAPGLTMTSSFAVEPWTVTHDATTLGGNSGSIVLIAGQEQMAAGLHYGGRSASPQENWGHILGQVLDQTNGRSSKTLREHLLEFGVDLV
jgi:V8-like Glu-specific endopeptidase